MKKILFISLISCSIHSAYAQQKVKVEKMSVQENAVPYAAPDQVKTPAAAWVPDEIKAAILTPVAVQEIVVPPLSAVAVSPAPSASRPVQSGSAAPVPVHP